MHLDQHIHARGSLARPARLLGLRRRLRAAMIREHAVRANRPRLDHLVGIEGEVLTEAGQGGGVAGLAKIGVGTLKMRFLGQAPRGRSPRRPRKPSRALGGSKSARIRPLEGDAFLISAISAKSVRRRYGAFESPWTKPLGGGASDAAFSSSASGAVTLRSRDIRPLDVADLGEDVGHVGFKPSLVTAIEPIERRQRGRRHRSPRPPYGDAGSKIVRTYPATIRAAAALFR